MKTMTDLQEARRADQVELVEETECELLAGTAYGEMFDAPPAERIDPRFVARLDDVAREERRRNGRRIALTAVAVVAAVLVALVATSGLFAARQLDVEGTVHLTADDVRRASGVHGAPSMLGLDTGAVARRVERLPWVADAQVSISWPNTLVIRVTEWEPVAYVADHGRWALLASPGRVLADVLDRPAAYVKVVGLRTVPRPGSTITGGASVDVVNRLPDALRRQLAGLDLAGGGVTLRLDSGMAVRLGDTTAIPAKSAAALAVLAAQNPACHQYVDVAIPSAPVCG